MCLKRIFEVSPVLCVKCGGVMVLTALIQDDREDSPDKLQRAEKPALSRSKIGAS